jgi:hypothetical protein
MLAITKDDRLQRKKWIDERTRELVAGGVAERVAKTHAGKYFAEQNPWWKEGSTRGKV